LNFDKGMEEEHCIKAGCETFFVSSNYGVRTTPKFEYEMVIGKRTCPAEQILDKKGVAVRVIPSIEALTKNKQALAAKLIKEEVIALVLRQTTRTDRR